MTCWKKRNNWSGFTLLELLIVVMVVAVLSAIAYPLYSKTVAKSRIVEAINLIDMVKTRQGQYYTKYGQYFSTFDPKTRLTNNPKEKIYDDNASKLYSGRGYDVILTGGTGNCVRAKYSKGGVEFELSSNYETHALGCTSSDKLCETFGNRFGYSGQTSAEVCNCGAMELEDAKGYALDPETCRYTVCNKACNLGDGCVDEFVNSEACECGYRTRTVASCTGGEESAWTSCPVKPSASSAAYTETREGIEYCGRSDTTYVCVSNAWTAQTSASASNPKPESSTQACQTETTCGTQSITYFCSSDTYNWEQSLSACSGDSNKPAASKACGSNDCGTQTRTVSCASSAWTAGTWSACSCNENGCTEGETQTEENSSDCNGHGKKITPCEDKGTYWDWSDNYSCQCDCDYTGTYCDSQVCKDECTQDTVTPQLDSTLCNGHGYKVTLCSADADSDCCKEPESPVCTCVDGYELPYCEDKGTEDCTEDQCWNGTECEDKGAATQTCSSYHEDYCNGDVAISYTCVTGNGWNIGYNVSECTACGESCDQSTKPAESQDCTTEEICDGTQERNVTCNSSTSEWETEAWGQCTGSEYICTEDSTEENAPYCNKHGTMTMTCSHVTACGSWVFSCDCYDGYSGNRCQNSSTNCTCPTGWSGTSWPMEGSSCESDYSAHCTKACNCSDEGFDLKALGTVTYNNNCVYTSCSKTVDENCDCGNNMQTGIPDEGVMQSCMYYYEENPCTVTCDYTGCTGDSTTCNCPSGYTGTSWTITSGTCESGYASHCTESCSYSYGCPFVVDAGNILASCQQCNSNYIPSGYTETCGGVQYRKCQEDCSKYQNCPYVQSEANSLELCQECHPSYVPSGDTPISCGGETYRLCVASYKNCTCPYGATGDSWTIISSDDCQDTYSSHCKQSVSGTCNCPEGYTGTPTAGTTQYCTYDYGTQPCTVTCNYSGCTENFTTCTCPDGFTGESWKINGGSCLLLAPEKCSKTISQYCYCSDNGQKGSPTNAIQSCTYNYGSETCNVYCNYAGCQNCVWTLEGNYDIATCEEMWENHPDIGYCWFTPGDVCIYGTELARCVIEPYPDDCRLNHYECL